MNEGVDDPNYAAHEQKVKELMGEALPPEKPNRDQLLLAAPHKLHVKGKGLLSVALVAIIALSGVGAYWAVFRDSKKQEAPLAQAAISYFGVAPGLIEGQVEYSQDAGESWRTLTSQTDLKQGMHVRTLADGRAVLLIDDGSAVRLASNSRISLTSLDTTNVVVTQESGEVYSRVVAASSRTYKVATAGSEFTAKGTAFRTFETAAKKGVEVYHSAVSAKDQKDDITEGNAFFSLNEVKEKEGKITAIDVAALKSDEFVKWNSEQDKKDAEFSKKLGVLAELDKPDPTPPPAAAPAPSPAPKASSPSITLSGSVSEYTANFSWKVSGVDTSKGYKLVKSKTSKTPTYPNDSAAYVESGKTSYSLFLGDGKTYFFRICAYRDGSCESYSNAVTITTAVKEKEQIVSGTVDLTISGGTASWNFTGTAPYGFKLVIGEADNPTYPSSYNKFSDGTSAPLPDGLTSGATYYARVCKYKDGDCVDYSNQVIFTAP